MISDQDIMAQVLAAFRDEQAEHRQAIGELLLELEREPDQPQRRTMLDQLFREAHSLKGSARAAGQDAVEQIAHRLEDVLSAARQGTLQLTPEVCDPIYAALDAIGDLSDDSAAGMQPRLPDAAILEQLERAIHDIAVRPTARDSVEPQRVAAAPADAAPADAAPEMSSRTDAAPDGAAKTETTSIRLATTTLDSLLSEVSDLVTCTVRADQRARAAQELAEPIMRWRRVWRQARPALSRLQKRAPSLQPIVHYLADHSSASAPATTLDQDTGALLDALLEAQRVIADLERRVGAHARDTAEDHDRLAAVTDRLHEQIRHTRMLPVTTLLAPLRLQLREMARSAGKQIALELDDGGAEADRQVLDRLRDVLLHLLRNAVDHGIETPAARAAAGKPETGQLVLRTSVTGDRLTLSLADDGAGLDVAAIQRHALAAGLVSAAEVAQMRESELIELIFAPGFSTKGTISALSGRGVGLDIVRAQIERMHGRVAVESIQGQGTTFSVSVPLSLTSTQSLLVGVASMTYALPLDRIGQILPVRPSDIVTIEGRSALLLDSRPVPLARMADLLGLLSADGGVSAGQPGLALILSSGERQVGMLVDTVVGEQSLVVQRLPAPLQQVPFLDGATILADGSVVPLLDVVDLVRAGLGARPTVVRQTSPTAAAARKPTILVVDDSITTRTLERNILENAGFCVRLATDGVEALTALEALADEGGCDLVVSDVDMPRLNGFELTAQLRVDARFKHLPVVLVTSLEAARDRERGIAAGADAYIVKRAFDQQALLDTINQLI